MAQRFRNGNYGYGDAKKALFSVVNERFADLRDKREKLLSRPDDLVDIMKKGAAKARAAAAETLETVRSRVGVLPPRP
jgi:tryptophanyl-tRNA synthetase